MSRVQQGDHTVFYLPPTHEPYLPLLPAARRHRPLASTHCAYPRMDGQAELTWVAGLVTYRDKCRVPRTGIKPGHGYP